MPVVRDISPEECQRLLRGGVFGRVAVCTPAGPHVVPVNYSVVDDSLVIATSAYSALGRYGRDTRAAFEIDDVDYERHTGWSVIVHGQLRAERDPHVLDGIRGEWPPRPWATGSRTLYLRLSLDEITGRRVGGDGSRIEPPVERVVHRS